MMESGVRWRDLRRSDQREEAQSRRRQRRVSPRRVSEAYSPEAPMLRRAAVNPTRHHVLDGHPPDRHEFSLSLGCASELASKGRSPQATVLTRP